ncbi:hypothetical protein MLD38_040148 [Melastoma candidum]|uniref:Uncharacterized protein n=1 Tax=Melastoma candidum TaxID=119954 RepID=A0ACB9L5K0_9MYRT|nr:hypothetical protein MLD38_040148 [Melastoma candidum]
MAAYLYPPLICREVIKASDYSTLIPVLETEIPMDGFDAITPPASGSSSSPSLPPPRAVISPCAACKALRRRCDEKCILAPYFPPSDPVTFAAAHRVFGASNIIKFLQELPEGKRADAVSSMVYEAGMRIRDPVYGCAGVASQLLSQITLLQVELANARAKLAKLCLENSNLVAFLCDQIPQTLRDCHYVDDLIDQACSFPEYAIASDVYDSSGSTWDPLWI